MTPKTICRSVHAMFTRNLALLWIGQTISMAGDSVYTKALIWLLLDMTGSSGTTGLVAVSAYLPTLLTGVWAGAVVDRSDHRRVM
ncbi:MAG TPA: MFS transporter, partial [Candidatus Latescibacteria bacterium]|nr:MFS transporter [Candidatus Latescibacterota bacterium]